MAGFISKSKLSKKAQKELNRQRRKTWGISPVTRTVNSKKLYSRKKKAHDRYDDPYGMGFSFMFRCHRPPLTMAAYCSSGIMGDMISSISASSMAPVSAYCRPA